MSHQLQFLREFLRAPGTIGAVTPSSVHLAKAMVEEIGLEQARAVVEFGPGTGVFTEQILRSIPPDCRFFAIEQNPSMASVLRKKLPRLVIFEDSAVNVRSLCAAQGIGEVDCILSGLPWASFDNALQDRLLEAIRDVLVPGGRFATFAYLQGLLLPAGMRFREKLRSTFSEVRQSPIIWRNLPPAFVYRCRK